MPDRFRLLHPVKMVMALGPWAMPVLLGTGARASARLTMDMANAVLLRKATVSLNMVLVDERAVRNLCESQALYMGVGCSFQ